MHLEFLFLTTSILTRFMVPYVFQSVADPGFDIRGGVDFVKGGGVGLGNH